MLSTARITCYVKRYFPEKMYGFLMETSGSRDIFFHLGVFKPLCAEAPVPPVVGEQVEVEMASDTRAGAVYRLSAPIMLSGVVEFFDVPRGFGYILAEDGKQYYLHRSEVQEHKIPLRDKPVRFAPGIREGKLRACHVEVL